MNAQTKNLSTLAAAVMLALAAGSAAAADNSITLEQAAGGNGIGNYANITATGADKTLSIYQIGSGNSENDGQKNRVGGSSSLDLSGDGPVTAYIGQGGYRKTVDQTTVWDKSLATKGNLVEGKIQAGTVEVSQNSDGNTATLDVNGTGTVTITQGKAAPGGGGGSGFTASVKQTGEGAVTITQGATGGTGGLAEVVHTGKHTVAITQDGSGSVVKTNTTGDGTTVGETLTIGSLAITQSGTGKTYVNTDGFDNKGVATITGKATLENSGSGILHLTKAEGEVVARVNGGLTADKLTITNTGSTNKVYVSENGDGTGGAGFTGGELTLNSNGTNNTIRVASYMGGATTINQKATMTGSTLALSSTAASNVTINQNGDYQNATLISANGSTGSINLEAAGTSGSLAAVNLTY